MGKIKPYSFRSFLYAQNSNSASRMAMPDAGMTCDSPDISIFGFGQFGSD